MIVLIQGRAIAKGKGMGPLVVSPAPISFLSGVDPKTGFIVESGHPLKGRSISGCVLAFDYGKGSTVGSYILYALHKNGKAPAAIINTEAEPIIVVGAIISGIPMVDRIGVPIKRLLDGTMTSVDGDTGVVVYEGELEEDPSAA